MIPPPDRSQPPLIKTRLSIPQLRAGLVARPRLLSLLSSSSPQALTLICAPAGYGKTTLLVEWIASLPKSGSPQSPAVCWLSLDEDDNDPALFLNYLVTAFETGNQPMGSAARALLHAFPPPPLKAVLGALVNDLHILASPIYLVLDDYQYIANPAVHEAIAFFIDRLPPAVRVVIATRSDPPLPLARLRARNQLVELRADALRFTQGEVTAFLNQVMDLPLSGEDINTLENRTEGWIAGLQMAALAMRARMAQDRPDFAQFIQAFSGSHRYILDYLAEEALNRQPEGVQRFLFWTSILDRMCAPLCDAVLVEKSESRDGISSREMLDYLDQSNLFLIALDDERGWFRYHHLFADLLSARLRQSQPAIIPMLHTRASEWFEQNGYVMEAVQHAFSAQENDRAASQIERYGPTRWSSGDPALLSLISRLPESMLTTRPKLGIYHAWMLIAQGQAQAALPLLDRLKTRIPQGDPSPDDLWMRAIIHLLSAYAASPGSSQDQAALPEYELLERIPEQDLGLRSTGEYLYAILLNRRGQFDRSAEILRGSIQRARTTGDFVAVGLAVPVLARVLMMQGRLPEAAALCQEYLKPDQVNGKPNFYAAGSLNIMLGEVLFEWNDLENAEMQIRAGLQANTPWQNVVMDAIGYSDLVSLLSARGDLDGAAETMQQLERLLQGRTETPDIEEELVTIQVRLWLARGDQAQVEAWAAQTASTEPRDYMQGWGHLTLARVRLAQGRFAEAQRILETLSNLPGAGQRVHRQVRVDLLLALALFRQNQLPQAFQALEHCLALAQPGGYCRLFLESGAPVQEILQAYLQKPAPPHQAYVRQLLDRFPGRPPKTTSPAPAQALVEPLTPRELEVLGLMAAGYSNRQIAEQLVLSEGTVKFHVHSILEKIQVHSRTQAIIKARELKLVEK